MKDTLFSSNLRINTKGILREYAKPIVMGILNATPDSFYGDSRVTNFDSALKKAEQHIREGATIIDIGGYSSRPNATEVNEEEEIQRTAPLIALIKKSFPETLLSIDTFRSKVAEQALLAGADLINDISGGKIDPKIFTIAATFQCPYILMHMRGTPQTMQTLTEYKNLTKEILFYFSEQLALAKKAGVKDIILDPGFGFSKTLAQNYELLNNLESFAALEKPILVGVSRKSMIYKALRSSPEESLNGTSILNTIGLMKGAKILRVHDVKEAMEAVALTALLPS